MRSPRIIAATVALLTVFLISFVTKLGSAEKTKVIAIATLMSHPALDAVQRGIIEELRRQGFVEGKNVRFVFRNANGQVQLAASIARELVAQGPNITVSITTPMSQAVAKVARGPVVFAAVTDPVGAGLVRSLEKGEATITGTSDAWPYEDQLKLIRKITPQVKRMGVLYNPGEAASQYGIREIRKYAPRFGFKLVEAAANTTLEVYPVAQNLAGRVDALFLSSDNTVIGGMAGALKVSIEHRIPLYVGDSGTVEKGGLAAVSVGYSALGRETGKLVARVLRGERNIPTFVARGSEIYLNRKAAELMGVTFPADVLRSATKVFDRIQ
ncbi:ABC transporter substrate-binding protein [Nitrospinota bacterium]